MAASPDIYAIRSRDEETMATASDVARLAGTSTAVVSYVFNDGPRRVAPETKERVLKAAEMLQYKPNALARALSAGRSQSIGLVVPDITNPYFAEFARAIEEEAIAKDHLLLIGDSAMTVEREIRLIDTFVDRRVDSLVLASLRQPLDLSHLRRARIPVVTLHRVRDGEHASSLVIDYEEAAYVATKHLAEQGYRSIGILNGPEGSVQGNDRLLGFTRAVREFDIEASERKSPLTRAAAHDVSLEWLEADDRPRALFVTCDEQAFGVLSAAHSLGLGVPHDLAVIGVDGTESGKFTVPPLSSIRQPVRAMARKAVEILVGRTVDDPVAHEVFDFELKVRESSLSG
ncbi:LacI family DNA-binding transcriptional regulator [Streptosporangium sp. 'caverna']|uniref:LacI family DNA-binding transcriptional regulator n=1 Tax=Streptosporangium sp. 'caverna' TaxID=2202249 RepID=UPI000D7E5A7F|nr:LacI family DNA-binding transcriptional regulator [Streptosporangium sp. 'caverna']AWS46124.1 LacI family transcriptional regulator [Streptosporangium sp. 'caverna']